MNVHFDEMIPYTSNVTQYTTKLYKKILHPNQLEYIPVKWEVKLNFFKLRESLQKPNYSAFY